MTQFNGGSGSGPGDSVLDFPALEQRLKRMRNNLPGRAILLAILILAILLTSVYTVDPEEVGVVMRFGQYVRTAEPGLNFKAPLPLERVIKVPIERQLKAEFGYRTERAGVRSQYSASTSLKAESLMLTGDLNIADVEWVVQYRIVDPAKYLFRVRNVEATFRAMSEAVMREVVGDRTVNEVITFGREELAGLVEAKLQELCEQYETGLKVEQVVLQNVKPPEPVQPSFNEVNQAEQEKEEKINTAESEYNREVPRARGEAQQTIEQAEGYAINRVNRAEGDANRFEALYGEYRKAPDVTRTRLYLETLGEVLPKAGRTVVVDEEIEGLLPLLSLNQTTVPGGQG
ncbi:MAG: FtsH protease activity modulator HflK [Acidobacteriota bacterium]